MALQGAAASVLKDSVMSGSAAELLDLAQPFPIAIRRIRWEALRLAILRTMVLTKRELDAEMAEAIPAPSRASSEALAAPALVALTLAVFLWAVGAAGGWESAWGLLFEAPVMHKQPPGASGSLGFAGDGGIAALSAFALDHLVEAPSPATPRPASSGPRWSPS